MDIASGQKGEPMGRPLDEDMVINIIKNGDYYMTWVDRAMLIEEIKDLPFAQSEIIRCGKCLYYRPMSSNWGECKAHNNQTCHISDYCSWAERRIDA